VTMGCYLSCFSPMSWLCAKTNMERTGQVNWPLVTTYIELKEVRLVQGEQLVSAAVEALVVCKRMGTGESCAFEEELTDQAK
jgi:hypothetical protein